MENYTSQENSLATVASFKVARLLRNYVKHSFISEKALNLLKKHSLSGVIECAMLDALELKHLTLIDIKYYLELAYSEEFDYEMCQALVMTISEQILTEPRDKYIELLELLDTYNTSRSLYSAYREGGV